MATRSRPASTQSPQLVRAGITVGDGVETAPTAATTTVTEGIPDNTFVQIDDSRTENVVSASGRTEILVPPGAVGENAVFHVRENVSVTEITLLRCATFAA